MLSLFKQKPAVDLFDAVRKQDIKSFNQFILEGVDVNAQDENGNTALMIACDRRQTSPNMRIIQTLVTNGADVNKQNVKGEFAISIATNNLYRSTQKYTNIITYLIENGANVKSINQAIRNCIQAAPSYEWEWDNYDDLAKYLIDVIIDKGELESLNTFYENGEGIVYFINRYTKKIQNGQFNHLLYACFKYDKSKIAEYLIDKGVDVNAGRTAEGYTPLLAAVSIENNTLVRKLLDKGADINAKTNEGKSVFDIAGLMNPLIKRMLSKKQKELESSQRNSLRTPLLQQEYTPGGNASNAAGAGTASNAAGAGIGQGGRRKVRKLHRKTRKMTKRKQRKRSTRKH